METTNIILYSCIGVAAIMGVVLLMIKQRTNAFTELKARRKGYIMAAYFGDDNNLMEFKAVKVGALLQDKHYGSHLLNQSSVYTDTNTRIPIAVLPTSVGTGVSIPAVKASDALMKLVKDPRALAEVREAIDIGEEIPELSGLKENISFHGIKYLLNAITPHGIAEEVSKEVTLQTRQFMGGLNKQTLFMVLALLGGLALISFVVWKALGGGAAAVPAEQVIRVVTTANNTVIA